MNGGGRRVFSIRLWGERTFPSTEPIVEEALRSVIWHKKKYCFLLFRPKLDRHKGDRKVDTNKVGKGRKEGGTIKGQVL